MFRSIKTTILLLNGLTTLLAQFQGTYDLDSDYSHVRKEPKIRTKSGHKHQLDYCQKTFGVSLGGWLVLEPWIVPSLFDEVYEKTGEMPVDEYTYTKLLGKRDAEKALEEHWSSFYTEEDFQDIVDHGINLVRIPIGYWAFGLLADDPYVQGQEYYLDQAIEWADKYNLQVQIDIHGMPGSQNGFDNSGKRTDPTWLNGGENMELTYDVMDYFFNKYGGEEYEEIVTSIEVVNEPFAFILDKDDLRDFYEYAYQCARDNGVKANLYFHDGFLPIGSWDRFMNDSSVYPNITIDHHLYEIFSEHQIALNIDQHIKNVEDQGAAMALQPHHRIVGEFSGAFTDCTKYINGVGMGARYDGTFSNTKPVGSCKNHNDFDSWSEEFKNNTKEFIKAQFETFEKNGDGWIFWCFKTEDSIEWDFKRLASLDMLPESFLNRKKCHSLKTTQRLNNTEKNGTAIEKTSDGSSSIDRTVIKFQQRLQLPKIIYIGIISLILLILAAIP